MNRSNTLRAILDGLDDHAFTVTQVRDLFTQRDASSGLDKAQLRRWVNGRFKTLVNNGTLSRSEIGGKIYFKRVQNSSIIRKTRTKPVKAPPKNVHTRREVTPKVSPNNPLLKELNEAKLLIATITSELQAYLRISEAHPEYREIIDEKFTQASEEKCKVLGDIKALETILTSTGTAL